MKLERRNAYICPACLKVHVTVDVHKGVTPMFIKCEGCGKWASSFMYRLPPVLMGAPPAGGGEPVKPAYEWYKPEPNEYSRLSEGEKEHVDKGGLLMRERTNVTPLYHV